MCLIILLALIGPRVALFFTWLFTSYIERAFDSFIVPLLGFVVLPWTTLVYALAHDGGGLGPLGLIFVVFAFLVDVSSWGSARRGYDRE